jgi:cell division protein FtsN
MSDQGFREVQLSGKQVVFLFMALAVALIGTFLLGVSVGRHVEPEAVTAQATPTATPVTDLNSSAPMPPPTTPAPGDLQYPKTLRGADPSKPAPSATPPVAASPTATPEPAKPTPTPSSKPASPAPANGGQWFVQVDSFSAKTNADRQVSDLKAKNVAATIVRSGTLFQVRVGPFERSAADAMHARLQKLGYKPRLTR